MTMEDDDLNQENFASVVAYFLPLILCCGLGMLFYFLFVGMAMTQ